MNDDVTTNTKIEEPDNDNVIHEDIVNELKQSYINYAMSVIVERALDRRAHV